ncbi:MAG: InlB B-repeat-containing protein, partial [Clostridia bacterium]|nr:InlB B-repeat-containing protein [Clostridia bacterium]
MDKKNYRKKSLAILTIALILIIALSCVFAVFGNFANFKLYVKENNNNLATQLGRPTVSTAGDLSHFENGVKYVFTDKSKVDGFRSGTEDYDTNTVIVDTSQPIGTQENPYVITSTTEWEIFVKKVATDGTHGTGQYYVLGSDLDFSSVTPFRPVARFNGTFYGLGYSLKNITIDTWQYWNDSTSTYTNITGGITYDGFGIFCSTDNAIFTDLILENFYLKNAPFANTYRGGYSTFVGGILGTAKGNVDVLNCHVEGAIINETTYGSYTTVKGSLVGWHNLGSIMFYRCSAKTELTTVSSNRVAFAGGMLGDSDGSTTETKVYDCVFNMKSNMTNILYDHVATLGWSRSEVLFENIIGIVDNNNANAKNYSGALTGTGASTVSLKNCYVDGVNGPDGGTKLSMQAVCGNVKVATNRVIQNVNNVKSTSSYTTLYSGSFNGLSNFSGVPTEYANRALLLNAAKNNVGTGLLSQIWDKDKIDGDYSPDNSPVRNYLVATITFKNLLSGDSEENVGLPVDDYMKDDPLPTPSSEYPNFKTYADAKANHVFLGWTTDKSGDTEPYTKLPSGVFGDVTMYAVWGLPDSYVTNNIKTSITSDKDKIEYDSVESITLTAKVQHTEPSSGAMKNPSIRYYFKQDGKERTTTESVKKSGELEVNTVADSGEYTFDYRITDGSEPLWYHDGSCSTNKEITIEKGKLTSMTLENFKLDSESIPYYGKPLKLIEFSCVVKNKAGKEVLQESHKWEFQEAEEVAKGTNKTTIVIVPADKDNYEKSYTFEVEFESKALTLVFDMQDAISRELAVDVTYGQNYGSAEIIYLFQTAFMKALESGDRAYELVKNKAPYLEEAPITPDASGKPTYSGEFNGINKIERIKVTFESVTYKVTFNYDDEGATPNKVETYGYGQYLKKPTPNPTYKDLLFVGWYFDEISIDDDGNEVRTPRAWRFNSVGDIPQDRVSGELELTAKWLKANTLDKITVEVDSSKKFVAQTKIVEDDLVVTAYYSGTLDGVTVTQDVVLTWEQYNNGIKYATSDSLLHVTEGGYEVTVSYQFGSTSKEASVKINVLPITISTDKLTFADKVVICTDEEKNETIDPIKGTLPSQIKSVAYVYMLDGVEIPEEDVKGIGDFIVQAVFTMRSADFYAAPMTATLKIVRPTELEKPVFKGGAVYDGTEKNVEDYLDGFDSDFMEIIGEGATATDAGRYTVYVKLKEGSWADGTTDNVTITWTIDKSTLIPNWDKWEFVTDGESGYAPVISGMADGLASGDEIDYANDFTYKIYDEEGNAVDASQVSEVGSYRIVATINGDLGNNYKLDDVSKEWYFVVVPKSGMSILTIEWGETQFLYDGEAHYPTYVVKDRNGDEVTDNEILSQLKFTEGYKTKTEKGTYTVKVTLNDTENYFIRSGAICTFKIVDENGNAPDYDPTDPNQRPSGNDPGSGDNSGGTLDEILQKLKEIPLWQIIVGVISIILILIFLSKTAGYESRRREAKRLTKDKYTTYYAGAFLGLAMTGWTAIACVLMGLAVASLVIMLIAKSRCKKAERVMEDAKEEYLANKAEEDRKRRDDDMQMMFMRMMGGQGASMGAQPQGAYMGGGYGIGAEDIRGIISDTVTALLPGMQQLLPQQASTNDELVQKLLEKSEKNEETMQKMMAKSQKNEEAMQDLIRKLAEQPSERVVEKEVAVTSAVNEDVVRQLIDKNDERIEQMMKNQEALIAKLLERDNSPQVIEKVVEVPVEVEKIVEKEVKVEVPVEVEKIVEKEVVKEVPVEKIVEVPVEKVVEKVVEKEVKVKVTAPAKPKAERAPRLTLDEA